MHTRRWRCRVCGASVVAQRSPGLHPSDIRHLPSWCRGALLLQLPPPPFLPALIASLCALPRCPLFHILQLSALLCNSINTRVVAASFALHSLLRRSSRLSFSFCSSAPLAHAAAMSSAHQQQPERITVASLAPPQRMQAEAECKRVSSQGMAVGAAGAFGASFATHKLLEANCTPQTPHPPHLILHKRNACNHTHQQQRLCLGPTSSALLLSAVSASLLPLPCAAPAYLTMSRNAKYAIAVGQQTPLPAQRSSILAFAHSATRL